MISFKNREIKKELGEIFEQKLCAFVPLRAVFFHKNVKGELLTEASNSPFNLSSRFQYLLHDLIFSPQGGGKAFLGARRSWPFLRALWRGMVLITPCAPRKAFPPPCGLPFLLCMKQLSVFWELLYYQK